MRKHLSSDEKSILREDDSSLICCCCEQPPAQASCIKVVLVVSLSTGTSVPACIRGALAQLQRSIAATEPGWGMMCCPEQVRCCQASLNLKHPLVHGVPPAQGGARHSDIDADQAQLPCQALHHNVGHKAGLPPRLCPGNDLWVACRHAHQLSCSSTPAASTRQASLLRGLHARARAPACWRPQQQSPLSTAWCQSPLLRPSEGRRWASRRWNTARTPLAAHLARWPRHGCVRAPCAAWHCPVSA